MLLSRNTSTNKSKTTFGIVALAVLALLGSACAGVSNPEGWAAPAVVDNTLYASIEKGKIAALDPEDLSVKWVFPPDTKEGKKLKLEGIYGAPAVGADAVYFGAHDNYVYAVDKESGALLWEFKTGDPIVATPTLVEDQLLYVASTDGRIYILDAESGAQAAQFDTGSSVWAAPLVTETTVYVAAMNGHLYALDIQDLDPVWDKKLSSGGLLLDPFLANEDTLITGGISEKLFALDPNSGEQKWSFPGGNWFWGRPLIDGDTIYVPNLDGHVYALNLADGTEKWSFTAESPIRSAPLLADDVLLVIDKDGGVYGLDPETGAVTWGGVDTPVLLRKGVLSDPILLDNQVLVVAKGGDLFRIDPTNGAQTFVAVAE